MQDHQTICRHVTGDAESALLERRWFAAFKSASQVRAECESLLQSMVLAEGAWNRARARLAELEALRDALGEELDALDEPARPGMAGHCAPAMSAATRAFG